MRRYVEVAALMIAGLVVGAAGASAQPEVSLPSCIGRHPMGDAWWTGRGMF